VSADMTHAPFPSEETLAAYIDGRLDEETRKRVTEHLSNCGECLNAVIVAGEHDAAPAVAGWGRRQVWPVLAAVAATVVALIFLGPSIRERYATRDALHRLAAAAPSEWPVEGRLTAFPYRPQKRDKRGGTDNDPTLDPNNAMLLAAFAGVQQEAQRDPSPDNLHALGDAHLLLGHADEAIADIESALKSKTGVHEVARAIAVCGDADLLNDLSAAYQTRAARRPDSPDELSAIEASRRAVSLKVSAETQWNYALALERLHMRDEATAAWKKYLRLDSGSLWSSDARQHLRQLAAPTDSELWDSGASRLRQAAAEGNRDELRRLMARLHQPLREWIRSEVVVDWARAVVAADRVTAAKDETICITTGALFQEMTGDATLKDEAALLARRRVGLAKAHLSYAAARALLAANEPNRARPMFLDAVHAFSAAGSPFRYDAALDAAACLYRRNAYPEVVAATTQLVDAIRHDGAGYLAVRSKTQWLRGSALTAVGRIDEAVDAYRDSIAGYERLDEPDNLLALTGNLATLYEFIGDIERSWALHRRTLVLWERSGVHSQRTQQVLSSAVELALRAGHRSAARVLVDASIARGRTGQANDLVVRMLLRRSELALDEGQTSLAARDLEQARLTASRIADPNLREFILTHPVYVNAVLRTARTPEQRLRVLDSALRFAESSQSRLRETELLLDLGREYARQNKVDDAVVAFTRAAGAVDRDRTSMNDTLLRERLVAARESVYRELIDYHVNCGRYDRALNVLDHSRAQTLRDAVTSAAGPVAAPQSLLLPRQMTGIVYYVSDARMLTWVISRGEIAAVRSIPVTRSQLIQSADRCSASLRERGRDWQPACNDLSRVLFEPSSNFATANGILVVVPDPLLANVPFAALQVSGRPLLERFTVVVSPSLSVFASCAARTAQLDVSGRSVLVVSATPRKGTRWRQLAGVDDEVRAIEAAYHGCRVIGAGAPVTPVEFFNAAAEASVIHFAGHAFVDRRDPRYSAIVLAGDSSRSLIYAHEIGQGRLNARLVVLSACETAANNGSQNAVGSIGSAFLVAGVPGVIGTLWPVDDAEAATFMSEFHRRLAAGADGATALRQTQLRFSHVLSSATWAAFRFIGGVTESSEV